VYSLTERVSSHIRRQELLKAGDRVGVAVSGGIDSVALLRLLLGLRGDLGIVLSVVHFNHKLRGEESDADEQFVADLARDLGLEFQSDSDDVTQRAVEEHVSVEAAARELRYGFFQHLIGEGFRLGSQACAKLDKIATGHTLDDQAETVLMRMTRGAGLRGVGGIYPRIAIEDDGEVCGEIVRPLLAFRRQELEQFLKTIGQPWREDSSNADTKFVRNRMRKIAIPLLEKEFNPAVTENLAELAEIARGEEDYWENEIAGWMGTSVHWSEPEWAREALFQAGLVRIEVIQDGSEPDTPAMRSQETQTPGAAHANPFGKLRAGSPAGKERPSQDDDLRERISNASSLVMNAVVDRLWFLGEPLAVQRRLVKAIGEHAGIPLEFKHVEEILRFAVEEHASAKELSLPLGWKVVHDTHEIMFVTPDLREHAPLQDYQYDLPLPGQVTICETGVTIEVLRIPARDAAGYNPQNLLDPESLPGPLRVRNWRPGDRFWPAHTKSPKKIKELLQERHVAQPERKHWPVVVSGGEIVWLRGFPPAANRQAKPGRAAVMIVEKHLAKSLLA
jgi:tRNA(Ile)-lysidine synthase